MGNIVIQEVIEVHCEEAGFLWRQRESILNDPAFAIGDLLERDRRLEGNLDGLSISGRTGWEICAEAVNPWRSETVFPAAVLAFTDGGDDRIDKVVALAGNSDKNMRPVISSFGWIDQGQALTLIKTFQSSQSPLHQRIALGASAILRVDPGPKLIEAFRSEDALVRARAFRMAGELGRRDCVRQLQDALNDTDESCRFWSVWSLALLGEKRSIPELQAFADSRTQFTERAIDMLARCMNPASVLSWHKEISGAEKKSRLAIKVAGALGDPVLMPWIIERMREPASARAAGEAFASVTGVSIEESGLKGARPEGFQSGPTDDPADENVAMDEDEFLPWPDHDRVKAWWERNRGNFKDGVRYLMGLPVEAASLKNILMAADQRVRAAAALESSLLTPGRPLLNVCAPAWRQLHELEKF